MLIRAWSGIGTKMWGYCHFWFWKHQPLQHVLHRKEGLYSVSLWQIIRFSIETDRGIMFICSAWKSGPVQSFIHFWKDQNQDWSLNFLIHKKLDHNQLRLVHIGLISFFFQFQDQSEPVMVQTSCRPVFSYLFCI